MSNNATAYPIQILVDGEPAGRTLLSYPGKDIDGALARLTEELQSTLDATPGVPSGIVTVSVAERVAA